MKRLTNNVCITTWILQAVGLERKLVGLKRTIWKFALDILPLITGCLIPINFIGTDLGVTEKTISKESGNSIIDNANRPDV
ncbi:MAG: hypothetical protein WC686_02950 [Candidatus Shapirobacteria bacterium]